MVLENSSKFDLNKNTQICADHDAILPEPRTEGENSFLATLGSGMFLLGMSDKQHEGNWTWNSDGSPVTWTYWAQWSLTSQEPNGGERENCVLMNTDHYTKMLNTNIKSAWMDIPCVTNWPGDGRKSLVCQRPKGMY